MKSYIFGNLKWDYNPRFQKITLDAFVVVPNFAVCSIVWFYIKYLIYCQSLLIFRNYKVKPIEASI